MGIFMDYRKNRRICYFLHVHMFSLEGETCVPSLCPEKEAIKIG